MNPGLPTTLSWPAPPAAPVASTRAAWLGPSAIVSLVAGFLTPFTVSLVGELPLGELALIGTAAWALLCLCVNRALPGELFHARSLRTLLLCQAIALLGYVIADFYWHSALRDVVRGWSRMVFLVVDIVAITYLFSRSRHNFLWLLAGLMAGEVAHTLAFGALFDDSWKFGFGVPVTYAALFLASFAGPFAVVGAALGLAALHFAMDFRSVGGLCVGLAAITLLQLLPRAWRAWALPFGLVAAFALVTGLYSHAQDNGDSYRASRSDIDRSSMIQAALEAVVESPFIGHGSWFSRSHVYDQFMQIRDDAAKEAGIGGFSGPNEEPEDVALHSQLLVALAEGGVLGGAFFIAFGAGILRTLGREVLTQRWQRTSAVRVLLLMFAAWNLLLSPFSGAHRVGIALAVGLMLLMQAENAGRTREEAAVP